MTAIANIIFLKIQNIKKFLLKKAFIIKSSYKIPYNVKYWSLKVFSLFKRYTENTKNKSKIIKNTIATKLCKMSSENTLKDKKIPKNN